MKYCYSFIIKVHIASWLAHHTKSSADQFFLSEKRATHAPFPLPIDKLMLGSVEWTKPVVVSRTIALFLSVEIANKISPHYPPTILIMFLMEA